MKTKLLIFSFAALCLGSAPAVADIYELEHDTALTFRQILPSDGLLQAVFDLSDPPTLTQEYASPILPTSVYEPLPWLGTVGFVGALSGNGATMRIGANTSIGDYTGFRTWVANDNQSLWEIRSFANGTESDWVALTPGHGTWLETTFAEQTLTSFGVDVRLVTGDDDVFPSVNDNFHVSVVPVPAAFLLGLLGLGVAGVKLRKVA